MTEKFTTWNEFEKSLNITPEQELEIQLQMDIIEATIEARKKNKLTQRELSKKKWSKTTSYCKNRKMCKFTTNKHVNKIIISNGIHIKSCTIR